LGSDVAWFQRDEETGDFLPPEHWRELAMASVTTHDLPTVAGWLVDEPVRVRAELGQLGVPEEEERARMKAERDGLIALLRAEGLLTAGDEGDWQRVSLALHALLVRSPARLVLAAPSDAVGDLHQPNLPGTIDEYPNWRLPLVDNAGRPVSLDDFTSDERVRRLVQVLRGTGETHPGRGAPDPLP
jgi:4-alpha-glucanotransferase